MEGGEKARHFWRFVHQAVLGPNSSEELCKEYALGGASCLLPDALTLAAEVLTQPHLSVREKFWRCVIATWLGCGGPAFRSFRYITGSGQLFGDHCPPEARLPPGDASLRKADMGLMYRHLEGLVRAPGHRPKDVLSGDGRFTMGRFGANQGLPMLRSWRDAFCSLVDSYGSDEELCAGLEARRAKGIDEYFRQVPGWSDLAIKELFTYMEVLLPRAFDADEFVPFGHGACAGARLVLGDMHHSELHARTSELLQRLPREMAMEIREAFRQRLLALPRELRELPGFRTRLERPHPLNVLDVEVCFCWFQAFLRGKVSKWKAFKRDLWL